MTINDVMTNLKGHGTSSVGNEYQARIWKNLDDDSFIADVIHIGGSKPTYRSYNNKSEFIKRIVRILYT